MSEDALKIGHLSFVLSKYAQEEWEKEKVSINWVNHSTDHYHSDSDMEEGIGREAALRIVKMLSDAYSINVDTERVRLLELIQKQASHDMEMASERATLIAENTRLKDRVLVLETELAEWGVAFDEECPAEGYSKVLLKRVAEHFRRIITKELTP